MKHFHTLTINGEKWTAYETDAKRANRKWSLQNHGGTKLGCVAFYAASLDEAVTKIFAAQ